MKKIILVFVISSSVMCTAYAREKINTGRYPVIQKNTSAGCTPPSSSVMLDINNVRTTIHNGGDMWWDLIGNAIYEVPKGSGKQSLFAGSLWIGGMDGNGQVRASMQMYRQNGSDYYPGPVGSSGSSQGTNTSTVCAFYDRIFSVTRVDVSVFRSWWTAVRDNDTALLNSQFQNYTVPSSITDWPGNNYDADYDFNLAPYWDENMDGLYNPSDGDYPNFDLDNIYPCATTREMRIPRLYGDICHWYVFNDVGNVHGETGGLPIGIEVRAQAFAFSTSDAVNDMTFNHYEIINRSTNTIYNSYIGIWSDGDLGDPSDDYTGCDVARGLGYFYNGDDQDGDGTGITYGMQPPAVGIDLFEGPYMDSDGDDGPNGAFGCDASINGLNFGDGVDDNERLGMTRFVYFNNTTSSASELYLLLQGKWSNGSMVTYGGDGHSTTGTTASFMFPGNPSTDPCGWGAGGVPLAGWSESSAGNVPGDRRFIMSSGPFTIEPGQINDLTAGVVWARASTGGAAASVDELMNVDDLAQQLFLNCFKLLNAGVAKQGNKATVKIFPNPSENELHILSNGMVNGKCTISVFDIRGKLLYSMVTEKTETIIDISGLSAGVFVVKVSDEKFTGSERIVKLK